MQNIPTALSALSPYKQFILWKMEDGKKVPISPFNLSKCDPHNPDNRVDGVTAVATANQCGTEYGVGFVFTANDPFFFVDIDKCLTNDNWSELAQELMATFNGAAIEVSQSGKGLHIIGQGRPIPHGCKNTKLGIEYYTEARFVALTGFNIVGSADTDHTGALYDITNKYFPFSGNADGNLELTDKPVTNWTGPTEDEKLLERALKSKSAAGHLGGRATFADLWNANEKSLAVFFPHESKPWDESSADAALASHLAFWTGKDGERMKRLMLLSGLKRDKYYRDDYLPRTINNACALCKDVLGESVEAEKPIEKAETIEADVPKVKVKQGYQFLAGPMQADYFKGCVYIRSLHRVLIPSGEIVKPEQFRATYGGYLFALDADGEKTTKNAFEAFTESQAVSYPQASAPAFRPDLEPGKLFYQDGVLAVNTYFPPHVPTMDGDPSPFLDHLAKLLPEQSDRDILLAYLAACVQHKGVKFQWAPLIQGAPGNGKTLFTRVVEYAVGYNYVHWPLTQELGEKYNNWLFGKILIGIEDIYVPEHKLEIIEVLKPMITNNRLACRAMQTDQFMQLNLANFILNTNHKNGIRKDENDRRFAVFYTAQQTAEDIERDGMGGDYFPKLYQWLDNDGYAIVAHYLNNYKIPYQLNPAGGCIRAPITTSTAEAIEAGKGRVESEILEAIDEGRPGFCGGWVSSKRLDELLENTRSDRIIPRNKRREVMQSLGYDYHPALKDGRVNNIIMIDGGKPRLYIKRGHIAESLKTSAEVSKAYEAAQTGQNIIQGVVASNIPNSNME